MPSLEFSVTLNKSGGGFQRVMDTFEATLRQQVSADIIKYMATIVGNWEHKPEFTYKLWRYNDWIGMWVGPQGKNADFWKRITLGTPPRVIVPRNAPRLVFPYKKGTRGESYIAKTTPFSYGGPGKKIGPINKRLIVLDHPGIKPRKFETWIVKWYAPRFLGVMRQALARATA